MNTIEQHSRPPWYSIAMLSMTALAYQILLMRLFSIIQWHHFAYMIISLALLGYGASGTFLVLFRKQLLARYNRVYLVNLVLFGISSLACYLLAQQIQFNAEEILWQPQQMFRLMTLYVVLALPFFFVANAIGLTLFLHHREMSRIYAADLFGAGFGGLLIIVLLFIARPDEILKYITALVMLTAVMASWELYRNKLRTLRFLMPAFVAGAILALLLPHAWTDLKYSPYKGLSQRLMISGTEVVLQKSSPLGLITVVESRLIPFRHAPGLSLNATDEPPEQIGVFFDADAMSVITRADNTQQRLSYLNHLTSALAYSLSPIEDVLVLGSGGGSGVLQARYNHVKQITAVELDKQVINLLRKDYKDFSGHIYDSENVKVYAAEARGFVAGDNNLYDLLQLTLIDSFSASSAGLYALSESYLYTIEALQEYLARLNPQGYLSISRWVKLPPRDSLKLFATAVDALRRNGIQSPENHLILIRSLQTSTLLIKNTPVTKEEVALLKNFCGQNSFDVAYYPGILATEANRYNILAEPYFYIGATAIVGEGRDDFIQRYKFNIQPATDDRPFFFQFFKWRALPEIMSLSGQGGVPLLEWGYLILIATLVQAIFVSLFLILLPLIFYRRGEKKVAKPGLKLHVFAYFMMLGLAFLFVEIAFIQKFILFLHHPIFAIAVVLAAFLVFAGMGSHWSRRFADSGNHDKGVKRAVLIIVIMGSAYLLMLGPIFSVLMSQPIVIKIILSVLLIAPLAFCMGMPFPLGLSRLAETNADLVPWVWGVNGCASVLSAIVATIIAIHFGFTIVVLLALALYTLAAVSSGYWLRSI